MFGYYHQTRVFLKMNRLSNNQEAFLVLLRAGLWENEVGLSQFDNIDYEEIYRLAVEQSVVGLVAAGIEHVVDVRISKEVALKFVVGALQLEHRNAAMNEFVANIIELLRKENVNALLVKGQGIAQCYVRPLWRTCGDVDLLLSKDNYEVAKNKLVQIASSTDDEDGKRKHLSLTIDPWVLELHGTLRTGLWKRLESVLDSAQDEVLYDGNVRLWLNGNTQVFLMRADEDIFFVFSHILQHFFVKGIGLRQICDWCRLLYVYKDKIDIKLLERRLKTGRLMREWRVFAALAVDHLGMPAEAMPLYEMSTCWSKKANKVMSLILETGNFGQSRDETYKTKYSTVIRYFISFYRHTSDMLRKAMVFPLDSFRTWLRVMWNSVK